MEQTDGRESKMVEGPRGFYCLSFIEQSLRLKRGEWLTEHASDLQKTWKSRLIIYYNVL